MYFWYGTRRRNPSTGTIVIRLPYKPVINSMTADSLEPQVVKASAAMVMTQFLREIPVSGPEMLIVERAMG